MSWQLVWTSDNLRRLLIGDLPRETGGLLLTLVLAAIGIVFSTVLGTGLGILRASRRPGLWIPALLYIEGLRNVPLVILVFWAYFIPPYFGLNLSKFLSVSIAIVIFNSAYIAEVVRAGIKSLRPGQIEAAQALGLGQLHLLAWVVLPQAFHNMIPALTGRYVTIVKNTSLAFLIGLTELTEIGREINNRLMTAPVEVYFTLLLVYFCVNRSLSAVTRRLENLRRFNRVFLRV